MKKTLLTALAGVMAASAMAGDLKEVTYANDTQFWVYDGFCASQDMNVGVATRFPANLFAGYAGAKVLAMAVGLGMDAKDHPVSVFMRQGSLNSENVLEGETEVTFSQTEWENCPFDGEDWEIPENLDEDLYFGYYTFTPKGKYIIYTSSLKQTADVNTCFMTNVDENEANGGEETWTDMRDFGGQMAQFSNFCIKVILEMPDGAYQQVCLLNDLRTANTGTLDGVGNCIMYIKNDGAETINSIDVKYTFGDKSATEHINMTLEPGQTPSRGVGMPMHYLGTGEHTVEITKVNGGSNGASEGARTAKVNVLAVPYSEASKHTRRPVLEYYCAENDYSSGIYQDNFINTAMDMYPGMVTFLPQHSNDKFGQNPGDTKAWIDDQEVTLTLTDADRLLIGMLPSINDVIIPAMSLDRTLQVNTLYNMGSGNVKGAFTAVLYPQAMSIALSEQLACPTFAGLEIESDFNYDNRTAVVNVKGSISEGVLPEGENLRLTLFLVEENVKSDSQEFPETPEIADLYPDGTFTHRSVVRATVTDFNGDEITESNFDNTYIAEVDNPFCDPDHMKVIALLQRSLNNDRWQRDIVNSAEAPMTANYTPSGVGTVEKGAAEGHIFDIMGRRLNAPAKGINIIDGKKILVK